MSIIVCNVLQRTLSCASFSLSSSLNLVLESYSSLVFDAKVLTLSDEKYGDLLCSLCGQTGAKTGELLFSEKDQARAGGLVEKMNQQNGAQLTLSKQTAPIPGGFILRQGQVEINCALDAIVRSLEE